ncbi:unnamed protein product [Clonostachys rosea]|uniref:Uncharacterized protein n=1 Tax=Bionectria ochroleuca TaxID=29856 RepID=A0ABY6V0T8_BIOOC|nr:unnamed protein product [Clonostachys rosea]
MSGYQHPGQEQGKPGLERDLEPKPVDTHLPADEGLSAYKPAGKLGGKRAVITGGDSGIGRAVAMLFAMEGAKVAIVYLPDEKTDAFHTKQQVERNGGQINLYPTDIQISENCRLLLEQIVTDFGGVDILVNNAGYQLEQFQLSDLSAEQWGKTFRTNIDSYFYMVKHSMSHFSPGAVIINNASVDAYIGPPTHIDYPATKGAVVALMRALSNHLVPKGMRVNAVAPGPVWTPLIASSMGKESQASLKEWTPMGRLGQPSEVATCFVFLASHDSSFMSGQTLHPNGGMMVNG